jgi:glyoxalase-like protein
MPILLDLDHIVVAAERLADGVAYVENTLGATMAPGGKHPLMGTHNALLGLGALYLEVIAIDPEAPAPGHPRWFDLDSFKGPPRLTNWVARTDDLAGALALAPPGTGKPLALSRGDLRWSMAVPQDGRLPYEGAFPALISWQGDAHPAHRLPEADCRLQSLQVGHPRAGGLRAELARFAGGLAASVVDAPHPAFTAAISTPGGVKTLT